MAILSVFFARVFLCILPVSGSGLCLYSFFVVVFFVLYLSICLHAVSLSIFKVYFIEVSINNWQIRYGRWKLAFS